MEPLKKRSKRGPEAIIQDDLIDYLTLKSWFVMNMHGNMYQMGVPDLYATHYRYGARWVEVKLPAMQGSKFTPAQMEFFPKLTANGAGIWILTAATDEEYEKLFKRPNWYQFLDAFKEGPKNV